MARILFLRKILFIFTLGLILLSVAKPCQARMVYEYDIADSVINNAVKKDIEIENNNFFKVNNNDHLLLNIKKDGHYRYYKNQLFDFGIIIFLIGFLAVLRYTNASYFSKLYKSFFSIGLNSRPKINDPQTVSGINFSMNVFVCITITAYIYYTLKYFTLLDNIQSVNRYILFPILLLVVFIAYLLHYFSIRFADWLFNAEDENTGYLSNVFLVNKIIALILLPFIAILAFGQGAWVQVALLISFVLIVLLFLNRYARSGSSFRAFLKYSKFHFFLYLCAFEILPIFILCKVFYKYIIH